LAATLSGQSPLTRRPVIVEFSPYGPGTMSTSDGPAFNYLLVQTRGTGHSAMGTRLASKTALVTGATGTDV
jgi:hypothetical protein